MKKNLRKSEIKKLNKLKDLYIRALYNIDALERGLYSNIRESSKVKRVELFDNWMIDTFAHNPKIKKVMSKGQKETVFMIWEYSFGRQVNVKWENGKRNPWIEKLGFNAPKVKILNNYKPNGAAYNGRHLELFKSRFLDDLSEVQDMIEGIL